MYHYRFDLTNFAWKIKPIPNKEGMAMLINHNVNVAEIIPIWFALNKPMNNSDVASRIPISINAGVGIVAITKKAAPMAIIESVTDMSTLKVCKRMINWVVNMKYLPKLK